MGLNKERNTARHTGELSFDDLFQAIKRLLNDDGYASIMLPVAEFELFESMITKGGWRVYHKLNIIPRIGMEPNRVVGLIKKGNTSEINISELVIKNKDDSYTQDFIELLRPYYLYL